VREAPAAAVLRLAHRELEALTMSPVERAFRGQVAAQYAALLDEGRWFLPLRSALDAYVGVVQARVSGTIRVSLFKGDCRGVARRAAQQDPKQPAVATAG
jgi:argininosuccinate synthase